MCGIAGACGYRRGVAVAAVAAMADRMVARGPDDSGLEEFVNGSGSAVLASRRLAIIDPSPRGHQPMRDASGRYALVFNGMIFNFRELRERLASEGASFVSGSDTEVILAAYAQWGRRCVRELHGMFAFAIWDSDLGELVLARDRLGIKPLYVHHDGERLVFASQVKALLASGLVPARLSAPGIASFLEYGAVSDPMTAVAGVQAIPAAHVATFVDGALTLEEYWGPPSAVSEGIDRDVLVAELRDLLARVVESHLVADQPVGVFLSGGLDSSLVAALAAEATPHLRTVSVLFDEPRYSEARYIASVVERLGADHVDVRLQAADLAADLGDAFDAMDQPTFDGINTYVVAGAAARTGLKVALSGLGADELFGGYGHWRRIQALERLLVLPKPLRRTFAEVVLRAPVNKNSARKIAAWSTQGAAGGSYDLLRRNFLDQEVLRLVRNGARSSGLRPSLRTSGVSPTRDLTVIELFGYTRNVLLRDTDAMSMAHSLEVRVPYLADELVAWTLALPPDAQSRSGKDLLVAVASDVLPPEVLARQKHGFALPFDVWLRGPLRDEVGQTLGALPDSVGEIVDQSEASKIWQRFEEGRIGWLQPWSLYALARWARSIS